jgi:membrane-associated phospholipid phosphatase
MLYSLLSLDRALLLHAITIVPREYAWIIEIVWESVVIWVGLMLIGLWLYGVKREDNRYKVISLSIFSTIILTFLFYTIINLGLPEWRPGGMELTGARALIPHPTDNSFPSGHALFTWAALLAIRRFLPWKSLIILTITFGILTAVARVMGWVHYPWDILGGWAFWIFGGWIFARAIDGRFFREYIFARIIQIASFFKL